MVRVEGARPVRAQATKPWRWYAKVAKHRLPRVLFRTTRQRLSPASDAASFLHGTNSTRQANSDLFSTVPVDDASPATANQVSSADGPRHVLPKDLSNAVKHLSDEELDRLLAVTFAEAKRRGRLTTLTGKHLRISRTAEAPVSLTRGQLNAFVRLSRLASHPGALRDSSAYPNRTCGRRWRPTPRREEASTDQRHSGGETRHATNSSYGKHTLRLCTPMLPVHVGELVCHGKTCEEHARCSRAQNKHLSALT